MTTGRASPPTSPPVPQNPKGQQKFVEVQQAYETLGDPEKRRSYDLHGHDGSVRGEELGAQGFGSYHRGIAAGWGAARAGRRFVCARLTPALPSALFPLCAGAGAAAAQVGRGRGCKTEVDEWTAGNGNAHQEFMQQRLAVVLPWLQL